MVFPRGPEADVRETDGAPGEQRRETRQRLQPGEDDDAAAGKRNVRQRAEGDDGERGPQRSSGTINVGEDLGGVALFCERGEGARAAVNTGEANRDDGEEDDDVDEVAKGRNACVDGGDDERRGGDIDQSGAQEAFVVVRDEEADEEQREDVEAGCTWSAKERQ